MANKGIGVEHGVRTQLWTRKAQFMLNHPLPGDDALQEMLLLALRAALQPIHVNRIRGKECFTDAFAVLVQAHGAARRAICLSNERNLTVIAMQPDERRRVYFDRANALWGWLVGTPQAVDEATAVDHALNGLSAAHAWFHGLSQSCQFSTFAEIRHEALRKQHARAAAGSSGRSCSIFKAGVLVSLVAVTTKASANVAPTAANGTMHVSSLPAVCTWLCGAW